MDTRISFIESEIAGTTIHRAWIGESSHQAKKLEEAILLLGLCHPSELQTQEVEGPFVRVRLSDDEDTIYENRTLDEAQTLVKAHLTNPQPALDWLDAFAKNQAPECYEASDNSVFLS
jgi:hypothetical protein